MSLLAVSALLHVYVGWRILPALDDWPAAVAALTTVLVVSAALIPSGLRARRAVARGRHRNALVWAGLVCLGLFSSLFVLTVLRDAMLMVAGIARLIAPDMIATDPLRTWSGVLVALGGPLVTLWGFLNARRTAAVVCVDVPVHGLPPDLHGFTIVQISDIHVGPTIKRGYLHAIVQVVNRQDADMVAVTGDLVDGSVGELSAHVAPLAELRSRHGTFFVTGNHEYYSGVHGWLRELRRLGVRVLLNEHVVLRHGRSSLVVAGVADYSAHHFDPTHRSDPQAAIAGAPADAGVRLLLAHQPRSAPAAVGAGFDVQLSGHTHGGQFLPWTWFVRLQQPFTAGLHRVRHLWVYVSRGTGYWGPPKRFGAPSEITRVRLVPAAG